MKEPGLIKLYTMNFHSHDILENANYWSQDQLSGCRRLELGRISTQRAAQGKSLR
jgi:hypothetical protein